TMIVPMMPRIIGLDMSFMLSPGLESEILFGQYIRGSSHKEAQDSQDRFPVMRLLCFFVAAEIPSLEAPLVLDSWQITAQEKRRTRSSTTCELVLRLGC